MGTRFYITKGTKLSVASSRHSYAQRARSIVPWVCKGSSHTPFIFKADKGLASATINSPLWSTHVTGHYSTALQRKTNNRSPVSSYWAGCFEVRRQRKVTRSCSRSESKRQKQAKPEACQAPQLGLTQE